ARARHSRENREIARSELDDFIVTRARNENVRVVRAHEDADRLRTHDGLRDDRTGARVQRVHGARALAADVNGIALRAQRERARSPRRLITAVHAWRGSGGRELRLA